MAYGNKKRFGGGDRRSGGRSGGGKGKFNLDNYVEVKQRVEEFVKDFPEGFIQTRIAYMDGPEIIFEARVFRNIEEVKAGAYTSGFAREVEGKGNAMINGTSHAENGETSSVGRALANMGYGTTKNRASRSEMVKVSRMEAEHAEMLEWLATYYPQIPEGTVVTVAGEEHDLSEYISEYGEEIKTQHKLCRVVVSLVERALDVKWGE